MPGDLKPDGCEEEVRSKQLYSINKVEECIQFHKHSNYYKFLKVMSWVLHAVRRFREKDMSSQNC